MRLLWKYIRNYFLVYQLISHFLLYLQNYKEYEAEILDLQSEKYGLSFDIKKYTTSGWTLGDENVICIRAFKFPHHPLLLVFSKMSSKFTIFHKSKPHHNSSNQKKKKIKFRERSLFPSHKLAPLSSFFRPAQEEILC